ncbi:MAG: thiamine pyrophosphate-dependent dehydrogenase E1 component subunit alpha [Candidatus Omnitrophica bacterium]|nr:thiamine pyrophosphate-dependent dehydrogenase E1 component subunit alpha [Candidatus Omnitrophota bacterium]
MMLRIRLCEESFVEPIVNSDVRCPVHLYSGEEAVAAGVCASLDKKDYIFGTHRSHGHYLAKGGCMKELVAEIYGKKTGSSGGRGGSMHLIDPDRGMMGAAPIVAGTIALALGASLASSIRKDNRVTVSFFGDGATGEGVLYESLNFAALKKLPIIFVCENNLYSTHMSIDEIRPNRDIYKVGEPFGIKSYRCDGNDVLAVYDISKEAVTSCRKGEGPVFLEFLTYRMRGHVGPNDNIQGSRTDIRPKEEVQEWRERDPIVVFEKYLVKNGVFKEDELSRFTKEIENEIMDAYTFTQESPYSDESELENNVFKN